MLRDLFLGFKLEFSTPEDQRDSEQILLRLLGINCLLNAMHLRKNPETPPLYSTDIVYTEPDQSDGRPPLDRKKLSQLLALIRDMGQTPETAMMVVRILKGMEIFLDIPALYQRGKGDCNELVPVRVAELWRAGIMAGPYLTHTVKPEGGIAYHALIRWPDGSSEDPSLILGMGGQGRADERREEIRKNIERWSSYVSAAQHLMAAEGASPRELGRQIDLMGLVPRSGVFRSPYSRRFEIGHQRALPAMRRAA